VKSVAHLRAVDEMTETRSDDELLDACSRGETAALGVLFDRHSASLANFLGRAFSRGADVDDLVQLTFLQVWQVADRFKRKSSVRTWILGIGANVARNHSRGGTRRKLALASYQLSQADGPTPPMPDQILEHREKLRRLEAALETLSTDLRIAFVMCELEHVPGAEAAKVLGVRPGTIWKRVHEARRRLTAAIEEE
jgi:RNA polymerase sigma-70 factor (ECF subfamily)